MTARTDTRTQDCTGLHTSRKQLSLSRGSGNRTFHFISHSSKTSIIFQSLPKMLPILYKSARRHSILGVEPYLKPQTHLYSLHKIFRQLTHYWLVAITLSANLAHAPTTTAPTTLENSILLTLRERAWAQPPLHEAPAHCLEVSRLPWQRLPW